MLRDLPLWRKGGARLGFGRGRPYFFRMSRAEVRNIPMPLTDRRWRAAGFPGVTVAGVVAGN